MFYCPECGMSFTEFGQREINHNRSARCSECHLWSDATTAGLDIADDCLPFQIRKNVLSATWYHYTIVPNWIDEVLSANVWVHIGTKKSVKAIIDYKRVHGYLGHLNRRYIHKIELAGGPISPMTFGDENYWPEDIEDREVLGVHVPEHVNVVRYLNRYESPGQISLLLDPRVIRVTETVTLDGDLTGFWGE